MIDKLIEIGLNKSEAKIYLSLVHKGSAIASDLVKSTGIHRNIIYDNLDKLILKGLVSYITEGSKKRFFAQKADSLEEFVDEKQKILDEEKQKISKLVPQIQDILNSSELILIPI